MIDIRNFSFTFKNAKSPALDNITLSFKKGEFALITGPSGCGKSSLALCIAGFSQSFGTTKGNISVNGLNVLTDKVYATSPHVGIVQQDPDSQLVALSVEEEVAFGPENLCLERDEIEDKVKRGLSLAKASHLRYRATNELSGGEKQKIALASMLAMDPNVLIFDEPTSNMDPVATKDIFDSIVSLKNRSELTIIVIEHKLEPILPYADTLIVMNNGSIYMQGMPQKILRNDGMKSLGINIPHTRPHECKSIEWPKGNPILDVSGLCSHYGKKEVLHDVNFSAKEGEMICIMGENGSGKTTFINSLLGFINPSSGTIKICDMDTRKDKTSRIAQNVGMVFQNPNHQIFEDTVEKEILFAPKNFNMKLPDVDKILTDLSLPCEKSRRPHSLSFGQKRRLNIASIFSYSPKIIILDEPFVGQDYINASKIMDTLEKLKSNDNLILFVSHDPRMISKYCSRLVFFENGSIKYDGVPDSVFSMLKKDGKEAFAPQHIEVA